MSLRALLFLVFVASILLAWFSFQLGKLRQQADAVEYFESMGSRTFVGEFDNLRKGVTRTCSSNLFGPEHENKYFFIVQVRKESDAVPQTTVLTRFFGSDFGRKEELLWLARSPELDLESVVENLKKMPWLQCVVLDTALANRGFLNEQFDEYEVEQCPLTPKEVEKIQHEFPDLQIRKSAYEDPRR